MSDQKSNLKVRVVPPERQAAAIGLIFQDVDEKDRATLIAGLLAASHDDPLPLGGLLEAVEGETLTGAIWAQAQPGSSGVVWPPMASGENKRATMHLLVEAAVQYLQQRKVRIAQTLFEMGPHESEPFLRSAGFEELANLLYLVRFVSQEPSRKDANRSKLTFIPSATVKQSRLEKVIEQTYQQTRDCPRLNGVRTMSDVLEGYRSTGEFSPERWLIAQHKGHDAGCLLLADHPSTNQWELVYMGVVPTARGQGFGVEIAEQAVHLTQLAGRERLVLAVDVENQPARDMYAAAGFIAWDRRRVFLRLFP